MGLRIGFTTFADQPDITGDDRLGARILAERGVEVVALPWDAPGGPGDAGLDAVVMRSSWNYHLAPDAFAAWVTAFEARGVPVLNPAPVVRWNLHKRYLAELAAAGVAVPTTISVEAGAAPALADLLDAAGLDEVVIKPAVSLSAFETWRARRADAGTDATQAAFARLVAGRAVLVQRFIPEVTRDGELSFVFFDGVLSHAVRKRARAGDFRVQSDHGGTREPYAPTPALAAQAHAILAHTPAPAPPTYARVDGIDVDGTLVLMELELIDPELFLAHAPTAPAAFAAAILRQLVPDAPPTAAR
jgi:glutathione synthase/RimK-type ligase-like ATP-grasp enzyme